MKQSRTTLKELTAAYRAVLRHGILCNAIALGLIAAVPSVATAGAPNLSGNAFVFGDISVPEAYSQDIKYMGFGGRRMEFSYLKQNDQGEWEVVEPETEGAVLKYRNDFPNYNMLGRSLELAAPTNGKNVLYVGPVNLTLEDHDEAFKYNYQVNGSPDNNDADLPTLVGGVAWNESEVSIFTKLATLMGESNANQTVGGVVMFSRKIDGENDKAGSLSIAKTIAMIDGATVNANKISVTNDSELTFANRDTSLLNTSTSYYSVVGSDEPGAYDGIRSNGVTTLNADNINVKDSSMVVESGASAIFNATTMATLDNVTVNGGAALNNAGNMTITGSTFSGNTTTGGVGANAFGGALYNAGALTLTNTDFTGNKIQTADSGAKKYASGGAIYSVAAVDITGGTFSNNEAYARRVAEGQSGSQVSIGGALALAGDTSLESSISGVTFTGNKTTFDANAVDELVQGQGGAIWNKQTLEIDNSVFSNNSANKGGAIYTTADLFVEGSTFKNNTGAGTIFNDGGSLVINDSTFDGNELAVSSYGEFGGSSVNGDLKVVESTFKNGVGAIEALNHDAVIIQDGTEFIGNSGAYSVVYLDGNKVVDMRDLTFRNNTMTDLSVIDALNNGYSTDERADVYIQDVTMEGNSAKSAINIISTDDSVARLYNITMDNNAGDGIILGNNVEAELANITITNNKRGDGLGRLFYNGKTANFGGTNTFTNNEAKAFVSAAGATTTFSADSTTTFDTGAITGVGTTIVEDGATLNLGTVHVEQGTFTLGGIVNGDLRSADDFVAFNVSNTFDGDGRLNLNLKGVGTYNVFEDQVFSHANVKVASSSVFDYVWNESYDTITVSTKSANEIAAATGVKTETAMTVTTLANAAGGTAQQIGQILGEALADGNSEYVEHEAKKLAPEDKPVTHSVATNVQNQVLTLASNRMAGPVGRAGGDITSVGYGVWAQGLFNKSKYSDKFDGKSRGIALGADALVNKIYTIGAGYSFNKSDIDMKDNGGTMDIDSNTVFVYGQYKPNRWFINATLSNTVSKYTENVVVAGVPVETKYDVYSFGVQTMTGYDFASGLTPMVGARYLHVSTDGHERLLGYVDESSSSFLSIVGGAKYAFNVQTNGEVRWTPELRALATYDVVSDKNSATVFVPGGSVYYVAGDRMSRAGAELGVGLTAEWRGLELSVNYDLQMREDYTSHTGMLKLRYEF